MKIINEKYDFKILNAFSPEEKVIKFNVDKEMSYGDCLLPTYYYSSIMILIESGVHKNGLISRLIKNIEHFIIDIEILAKSVDDDSYETIREYIYVSSIRLRELLKSHFRIGEGKIRLADNNVYESSLLFEEYDEYIIQKYNSFICNNKMIYETIMCNIRNCIAIAFPTLKDFRDEYNCYVSLSGTKRDYVGNLSSNIMKSYVEINDLLKQIFGFKFIECHLTDETKRYTRLSHHSPFDGNVLDNPISYGKDRNKHTFKFFDRNYSCCEKKIVSYMKFNSNSYRDLIAGHKIVNTLSSYSFVIKYKPCEMCMPALIGCYNIYFLSKNDIGGLELNGPYEVEYGNVSFYSPLIIVK